MLKKLYSSMISRRACSISNCNESRRCPVKVGFKIDRRLKIVEPEMLAAAMPVGAVILRESDAS
jgi:hypothetical protein